MLRHRKKTPRGYIYEVDEKAVGQSLRETKRECKSSARRILISLGRGQGRGESSQEKKNRDKSEDSGAGVGWGGVGDGGSVEWGFLLCSAGLTRDNAANFLFPPPLRRKAAVSARTPNSPAFEEEKKKAKRPTILNLLNRDLAEDRIRWAGRVRNADGGDGVGGGGGYGGEVGRGRGVEVEGEKRKKK